MKLPRRRLVISLAAVVAGLAVAGCGGDDAGGELSAEELGSQADAICKEFDERLDALGEPTSPDQLETFLADGLALQREQLDELQDLDPPEELQSDWDAAMTALEAQIAAIQGVADAIAAGEDPQTAVGEATPEITRQQATADRLAQSLGLTECGADADSAEAEGGEADDSDAADGAETVLTASDLNTYLTDVNAASGALTSVGTSLQGAASVDDLRSRSDELDEQITGFEQAIASMGGYTIAIPALERQRVALIEEGDDVTKALRGFADATRDGDADEIRAQVPAITEAVAAFGTAAQEAARG